MAWYDNQTPQVQAFKDYQAIPEAWEEALEQFESFIENSYDWTTDLLPLSQNEEELAVIVKQAIAQFLMQDEKSQVLIKAGEQELLSKWRK